jgi:serine/threonine protein kinase
MSEFDKNKNNDETLYNDSDIFVTQSSVDPKSGISSSLPDNSILQGSKYRIIRKLGQGGFGITYEGVQSGLNRKVAIKEFFMKEFCCREDSTTVTCSQPDNLKKVLSSKEKFLKEARMIADLQHTNIIKIIDVFQENNTAYYVMEHIDGGSLQDKVEREGALPEKQALSIIRQIAEALRCVMFPPFFSLR